jgi:C-terminal processing protease CtpA/Prc
MDKGLNSKKVRSVEWNNSVEQKLWTLMQVWAEVKFNFVYFHQVPELDWNQEVQKAIPRIDYTSDKQEFYQLLQELVAKLNDGHTFIIPPIEEMNSLEYPPVELEMIEEKILISRIGDSEDIKKQNITPGLEVIKVNGVPIREYLKNNVIRFYSGGTKHWGEAFGLSMLLKGPANSKVQLELKNKDGPSNEVILNRNSMMENGEKFRYRTEDYYPLVKRKDFDKIIYFKFSTFIFDQIVDDFNEVLDELDLNNIQGMIIDLRYNTGGNSNNGFKILSRLIDRPLEAAKWKTRKYLPAFRAWGEQEEWYEDSMGTIKPFQGKRYSGPLVVLSGHNTVSAAEDFLVPLKFSNRAKIIGDITAGSTGNPISIALPGGYVLRVCTKIDTFPDGKEFVGVGIRPDIQVSCSRMNIVDGRDVVLDKALEALRNARDPESH